MYSFSGNCAASVTISTIMCLWAIYIYIPMIGPHVSCNTFGRSIMGIYKSLTDTWMWKLGLRQRNSGNICFEFSVLVLCSMLPPFFLPKSPSEILILRIKRATFFAIGQVVADVITPKCLCCTKFFLRVFILQNHVCILRRVTGWKEAMYSISPPEA